jgi:hypothetical protein
MWGTGIGGGLGLLSGLKRDKKRRNLLRDTLTGALAGGALGGGYGMAKKYMKGEPDPDNTPQELGLPDTLDRQSIHNWVKQRVESGGMTAEEANQDFAARVAKWKARDPEGFINAARAFKEDSKPGQFALETAFEAMGLPYDAMSGLGRAGGALGGALTGKFGLGNEETGADVGQVAGGVLGVAAPTAWAAQGATNWKQRGGWNEAPVDHNPDRLRNIGTALDEVDKPAEGVEGADDYKAAQPTAGAKQLTQKFDTHFDNTNIEGAHTRSGLDLLPPGSDTVKTVDIIRAAYNGELKQKRWLANEMRNNPSGPVARANNQFLLEVRQLEAANAAAGGSGVTGVDYKILTPDRNMSSLQATIANRRAAATHVDLPTGTRYSPQALSNPSFDALTGRVTKPGVPAMRTPGRWFSAAGVPGVETYRTPRSAYGELAGKVNTPGKKGWAALAALLGTGFLARQVQQSGRYADPTEAVMQKSVRQALQDVKK